MDFLTDYDVRGVVSATLADGRTILALSGDTNPGSIWHIWQLDLANKRLIPPTDLPVQRMPGEKHSGATFAWIAQGDGRERLYLLYGSRPLGAIVGPFPLTFQALPWYRPAPDVHIGRLRSILEQAARAMDQAVT